MDKVLSGILKDVASEFNIDVKEVEKVLNLPYRQMRHTIMDLELIGKTSNDVGELKTNFNMPALFKLYLNTKKLDKLNIKEEENYG